MLIKSAIMLVVLAIAVYTATYGLWAWRNGYRLGAIGTWLIAWLALIAPLLLWWHHARLG